jgi:spermidine synthase
MATVSVLEDGVGVSRLHINNRAQEGSSATRLADGRQAVLPLLLHPAPRDALFLGLGTGVTATTAAQSVGLRVDAVELLPEVIDASAHFRAQLADPGPGLQLVAADARRYVRSTRGQYDVIVADNFHPARSGSGSLYTVEHFVAIRERMAPGAVFCQWLPLHQLDLDTLRSIVRSFLAAHPHGWALLATYSLETPVVGLVATRGATRFDLPQLRQRLAGMAMPDSPADFGIDDDLALLGTFVAGPTALRRFAAAAPLNTDDHPVVAYLAPRLTYASDSRPADRLVAVLDELAIEPQELLMGTADDTWAARLAAYWSARDQFIAAGRNVQPTADVEKMLAQVRQPLLGVLRTSADFRPAYDPLLAMAEAQGRIDPAAARSLLQQLMELQPHRPEAGSALQQLDSAAALLP